jgi:hypothetical protein
MKTLFASVGIMAICSVATAEPKLQMTPGVKGGVLSTRITTYMLTDADKARIKSNRTMMASADVYAGAADITLNRGQHGMARTTHSVCFETWFTTEADYKFTIDVGGHQVIMSDHIVIPNDRRTCVQHELYEDVAFSSPGAYTYYGITSATTQMAGEKRTTGKGTISVR